MSKAANNTRSLPARMRKCAIPCTLLHKACFSSPYVRRVSLKPHYGCLLSSWNMKSQQRCWKDFSKYSESKYSGISPVEYSTDAYSKSYVSDASPLMYSDCSSFSIKFCCVYGMPWIYMYQRGVILNSCRIRHGV